jgi:hypothetical protein
MFQKKPLIAAMSTTINNCSITRIAVCQDGLQNELEYVNYDAHLRSAGLL